MTALDYPPAILVPKWRRLLGSRAVWALVDQAVLSAGTFLTNFVLIRTWPKSEYAEYGLILSFVLFLNNLHMSLVTYPLSIAAAVGDGHDLPYRARRALRLTLLLFVPLGLLLGAMTARSTRLPLVPVAVSAMLLWQLQETLRRCMMARLQNRRAVPGDVVRYLGQAAVAWVLCRSGRLDVATALLVVAASGLIALVIQSWQLGVFNLPPKPVPRVLPKSRVDGPTSGSPGIPLDPALTGMVPNDTTTVHYHWRLGQWLVLSNLVNAVTFYAGPWTVRYFKGDGEFAMLSAVATLLNASNPVLSTVAALVTPAVAKTNADYGPVVARRSAAKYASLGLILLTPYYGLLLVAPHWALSHFYKPDSPYVGLSTPVRLFVATYGLLFGVQVVAGYLYGLGKSRLGFVSQSIAAVTTAVVMLPLAARYGLTGAAWGGIVPMAVQLGVCLWFASRHAPGGRQIPNPGR